MSTDNTPAPQVEMVSELPELPEPNFAQSLFIGGRCVAESYTADQMRAYAQAALDARAGGDAKDAERWRAIRALAWRYEEVEASEFDEHGDAAIAEAALASQAVGVKDGR